MYGKLQYEGEYSKGKRQGKGKEYYSSGNILFEGEYRDGKRTGEGKEYYYNGEIKHEGFFLYGTYMRKL